MLVGAHVRAGPQLTAALGIGAELSADVVQIFTQSPRAWKPNQYAPEALDRYRSAQSEAAAEGGVQATFCHATYLINLAGPDPELHAKSLSCLAANLAVAEAIGSLGLVLHLGSHLGAGMEACLPQVADALVEVLDRYPAAEELVWLQDEPWNMGAWRFAGEQLRRLLGDRYRIRAVTRGESGSPATGSHAIHELELEQLLDDSVGGAPERA